MSKNEEMTVGKFIELLKTLDPDQTIKGLDYGIEQYILKRIEITTKSKTPQDMCALKYIGFVIGFSECYIHVKPDDNGTTLFINRNEIVSIRELKKKKKK